MTLERETYEREGFLLLKNFFNKAEVDKVLSDAKGVFVRQFVNLGYASATENLSEGDFNTHLYRLFREDFECLSNCGKQVQHLISLHTLSLSSIVMDLLASVGLKSPTISTRPVMFFNHPDLGKEKVFHTVDSHQDWRSMQGSLNSVVIWVPLININKELGALEILPGSHRGGLRTDHVKNGFGMVQLTEEERKQMMPVEVNVGDALLFSSLLVHQSGQNTTNRPRWSCHFRYNDLDEPTFIKRKFAHPYIYKPIDDLITPGFPTQTDIRTLFPK